LLLGEIGSTLLDPRIAAPAIIITAVTILLLEEILL
jgi:hypothetical protein